MKFRNANSQSPRYHLHSPEPHDSNLSGYHPVLASTNKNALQSSKDEEREFSRGTTFIRRRLAAPTLQVLLYLVRSRGQTGEVYFCASAQFLLAAPESFSQTFNMWTFHLPSTLWMQRSLLLVSVTLFHIVFTLPILYHALRAFVNDI